MDMILQKCFPCQAGFQKYWNKSHNWLPMIAVIFSKELEKKKASTINNTKTFNYTDMHICNRVLKSSCTFQNLIK